MIEEQLSGKLPDFIIDYDCRTLNGVGKIIYKLLKEIDPSGRIYYSIEISTVNESTLVSDITGDLDAAGYIFGLISEGGVTPCCAAEIVEDLIESMPHNMFR